MSRWPHISNKKIRLTLYYLAHGESLSTERAPENLLETKNKVLETVREIENRKNSNNDFQPTPGPLCDWCGYKPICPVWRHLYEKDKSPAPDDKKIKEIITEYFSLKDESKNKTSRLKELQVQLSGFMRDKDVLRLFGDEGYVSKTVKTARKYDLEKVEEILKPTGKWQDILRADEKKLEELLPLLAPDISEKIKSASVIKTSEMLIATKKKISAEESAGSIS